MGAAVGAGPTDVCGRGSWWAEPVWVEPWVGFVVGGVWGASVGGVLVVCCGWGSWWAGSGEPVWAESWWYSVGGV